MSKDRDDKKIYSAADIQQYLDGSMPAPKMHELEKAALEDPFLADALEGYQVTDAIENKKNLAALYSALEKKNESPRVIPFYKKTGYRAIAAILLLAAGSSLVYYLLNTGNDSPQLAVNRAEVRIPEPAGDSVYVSPAPKSDSIEQTGNEASRTGVPSAPLPQAAAPVLKSKEQETVAADHTMVKRPEAKEQTPEIPATLSQSQPAKTGDRISSITFDQKAARRKATQEEDLQDSASMDEIIVIGYGTQKKQSITGAVTSIVESYIDTSEAVPANGVAAFSEYIKNGKKLPGGNPALHGNVVVGFIVKRSGKLKDVKVIQPVSPLLDREAIRLIKEGPAWIRKQSQGRATVTIIF